MLNRPMLGTNNAMMEKILLRVANVPHTNIDSFVVILQNPFSIAIRLVWVRTQLRRLQEMEITSKVVGSSPNNSRSNTVSNPPVVAVSVLASNRIST